MSIQIIVRPAPSLHRYDGDLMASPHLARGGQPFLRIEALNDSVNFKRQT
jgi:hypothetical protein